MVNSESDSDGMLGWTEIHIQANRVTRQLQIMSNNDRWLGALLQSQVGTSRNWISFEDAREATLIICHRAWVRKKMKSIFNDVLSEIPWPNPVC
jgi:hypothetical protein